MDRLRKSFLQPISTLPTTTISKLPVRLPRSTRPADSTQPNGRRNAPWSAGRDTSGANPNVSSHAAGWSTGLSARICWPADGAKSGSISRAVITHKNNVDETPESFAKLPTPFAVALGVPPVPHYAGLGTAERVVRFISAQRANRRFRLGYLIGLTIELSRRPAPH